MIEEFVLAVREGREPACGAGPGLRTQEVIAAAYKSARERRVVDLERAV